MEKVAPSERFRRELDEVLAGVGGEEDPIETVGRLGARLILQQALEGHHAEVKARWWKAFDEARSPGEATRELQGIIADYKAAYPSAISVIETDLPALVSHLRFPSEHRKRIRTTNLLERTFVEVRRRTKVIGRFPGETSALSLIWAVLELSSRGWRGVKMNPKTVAEIERLRRQLREDPAQPATPDAEEVIAA